MCGATTLNYMSFLNRKTLVYYCICFVECLILYHIMLQMDKLRICLKKLQKSFETFKLLNTLVTVLVRKYEVHNEAQTQPAHLQTVMIAI